MNGIITGNIKILDLSLSGFYKVLGFSAIDRQ